MDNNNIDQLEEMRQQMGQLKQALENQKIITDKALRRAMVSSSSWLSVFVKVQVGAAPFLFLILIMACIILKMSWWPIIVWGILCAVSVWMDFKTVIISKDKIFNLSFKDLRIFLIKQTRQRKLQALIETVVMLPWLAWYFYEFFRAISSDTKPFSMTEYLINLAIAAVASIIVVLVIYRKINKTTATLLHEMEQED